MQSQANDMLNVSTFLKVSSAFIEYFVFVPPILRLKPDYDDNYIYAEVLLEYNAYYKLILSIFVSFVNPTFLLIKW